MKRKERKASGRRKAVFLINIAEKIGWIKKLLVGTE